jgi:hypothetical protein
VLSFSELRERVPPGAWRVAFELARDADRLRVVLGDALDVVERPVDRPRHQETVSDPGRSS